jgi:predicted dinucleotide-binding enzyme
MTQAIKRIWLMIALSTFGLISSSVMAAEFSMSTRSGKAFSLETADEQVTQGTKEFVICGDGVEALKKVKLWMPEHNHGSSAVQIGPVSEGCRLITRVNFTMPGLWEVRVELSDGDSGAFALDVE